MMRWSAPSALFVAVSMAGCRSATPPSDAGAPSSVSRSGVACHERGRLGPWRTPPKVTTVWLPEIDSNPRANSRAKITLEAPFESPDPYRVDADDILDRAMLLAELVRSGARFSGIRIHAALNADGTLTKRGDGEFPHLLVDYRFPMPTPSGEYLGPEAFVPGTIDFADRFTFSFASGASPASSSTSTPAHPLPCCAIREVVAALVASGVPEGTSGWLGYGDDVDAGSVGPAVEPWVFAVPADRSLNRVVDGQSCSIIR